MAKIKVRVKTPKKISVRVKPQVVAPYPKWPKGTRAV